MRLLRRLAFGLVILVALAVAGTAAFAAVRYRQGDRLLSVQTASMAPAIQPGDAVYTRPARLISLQVGDVVSYRNPADKRVIVSHRIVEIDHNTGRIVTKGDALELPDRAFPYMLVIGRVQKTLPNAGVALDWLHKPAGLMVAVFLPASLMIGYEVQRLVRHYNRKPIYRSPVPGKIHI